MTACLFASDLHGRPARFARFVHAIGAERPAAVFLDGDLLPMTGQAEFVRDGLAAGFEALRATLGQSYPRVFLILGNDDRRSEEEAILEGDTCGLWEYVHLRRAACAGFTVYGYSCVPPTPFRLKDWERYDVSRYVDPGCLSPEEGWRTIAVEEHELRYGTIEKGPGASRRLGRSRAGGLPLPHAALRLPGSRCARRDRGGLRAHGRPRGLDRPAPLHRSAAAPAHAPRPRARIGAAHRELAPAVRWRQPVIQR